MLRSDQRVLIIGAGPTGLGAAHRLAELGHRQVLVLEKEDHAGGLAASFTDAAGFTWDVGGHVLFSHYPYFDALMDSLLGAEWLHHQRESWIHTGDALVPYPFQNNIGRLPPDKMRDCLGGLIRAWTAPCAVPPAHFGDWIDATFGDGIARHFMRPYNRKVWAWPLEEMAFRWVGERVARPDLERVVFNVIDGRPDVGWGPNAAFRFPLRGGTGEIWRRLAARLPAGWLRCGVRVTGVETARKRIRLADGTTEPYDVLVSTVPLDLLAGMADLPGLSEAAGNLRHSTVHVLGIGLKGTPPDGLKGKCWMYFPDPAVPFYRLTVFSTYSPNNVPGPEYWSLMLEVSESPAAPRDRETLVDEVLAALIRYRLIPGRGDVVDLWRFTTPYGYPTPTLGRDQALAALLPALAERDVYSRGRFGGWKYEVSNQDHTLMQGVELADRLMTGKEEVTLWDPERANRLA